MLLTMVTCPGRERRRIEPLSSHALDRTSAKSRVSGYRWRVLGVLMIRFVLMQELVAGREILYVVENVVRARQRLPADANLTAGQAKAGQ